MPVVPKPKAKQIRSTKEYQKAKKVKLPPTTDSDWRVFQEDLETLELLFKKLVRGLVSHPLELRHIELKYPLFTFTFEFSLGFYLNRFKDRRHNRGIDGLMLRKRFNYSLLEMDLNKTTANIEKDVLAWRVTTEKTVEILRAFL